MQFTITDQKPAVLDAVHTIPVTGDYDPMPAMRDVLVDPLFDALPGRTVSITDGKGKPVDKDQVQALFLRTQAGTVDADAEDAVRDLLAQGLVHYDASTARLAGELFAVQAGASRKLPAPSPVVVYTAGSDVIPAAKSLLAGQPGAADLLLASIAYAYSPETLGFWFLSASAFDDFLLWFDQQTQALSAVLPADTANLMRQFRQLHLKGLTESLVLRADDADQLQEYSFARVVVHMLMQYAKQQAGIPATAAQQPECGVLPFSVGELFLPRTVVLVNAEKHARSRASRVDYEWRLVCDALQAPVKVVSMRNLSKLTALPRAAARAAAAAATAKSNQLAKTGRSVKVRFRKQPPSTVDILTGLMRALKRMKEVNRSQNAFKTRKASFLKANRRDPADFNKQGVLASTRYLPDLHVYVDTSGSISERNYQQAMMMLIKLAKKLDVNLYFNSFSSIMSQEVLLHTKGKSVARIWQEFQRVPKVNGGTDFEQIWRYINASGKRKARLSLVVTDFAWSARSQRVEHPKNLYYAPCGNYDWDSLLSYAKGFSASVRHIEPAIAQHLIGITA